jgi:excisionase family DNA binding protein
VGDSDSDSDKEWLTVSQAAARLPGVSPGTVRNLVAAGRLEAIRLEGGHRRIRADSVEAYRQKLMEDTADGSTVEPPDHDAAR